MTKFFFLIIFFSVTFCTLAQQNSSDRPKERKELILDRNFNLLGGYPELLAEWGEGPEKVKYTTKMLKHDMGDKYYFLSLYFQKKEDELRFQGMDRIVIQNINERLLLELAAKHSITPEVDNLKARIKAINLWADNILAKEVIVTDLEIQKFYEDNPKKFTAPALEGKPARVVPLDNRLKNESRLFLIRQKTAVVLEKKLKEYKSSQGLKTYFGRKDSKEEDKKK